MKSDLHPNHLFVIIPCYNCGDFIEKCLDSLLGQSFSGWTAIIADDCSDDDTVEKIYPYLKDIRISLTIGQKREWLMGNTLKAIRSLRIQPSDVVAILDGDDWLIPECLENIWMAHCRGYDLVYTDEEMEGQSHSIGKPMLEGIPPREQLWCFSHIRSFKAYLFTLLKDSDFGDNQRRYFRAAGDLSLFLPMAELAGSDKICFIPKPLYHYRIHKNCNFNVLRREQLNNNWLIRRWPGYSPQTSFFDFTEELKNLDKAALRTIGKKFRQRIPRPYSICLQHVIPSVEIDSWRAYHGLWVDRGVYLQGVPINCC